jgi:hypothetical protein
VRTPRPKPNKLHDELDALLDGRPVELTDELAPLVEAAAAFRGELATFELDPEVADRHLERVLERPATVLELPVRRQPSGWDVRRRAVAVALAAALVLAPATMASAVALPGQAMYPFKRAIEQLRVASVQWSPAREAAERTRVVNVRINEVTRLTELRMFSQLPNALGALEQAVVAAQVAVKEAAREGEPVPGIAAKLNELRAAGSRVVLLVEATAAANGSVELSPGTRQAIAAAVRDSQDTLPPPDPTPTDTTSHGPLVTTPEPQAPDNPGGSTPVTEPTGGSTPPSTPSSTSPPTSTTHEPTTTSEPEPTTSTEAPANPGSVEGGGQATADKTADEVGDTPPTTVPAP